MEDRSKIIYGNEIGRKAYRNAIHSKKKFIKKYGDDTGTKYPVRLRKKYKVPVIVDSDAHIFYDIGNLDRAKEMLEVAVFLFLGACILVGVGCRGIVPQFDHLDLGGGGQRRREGDERQQSFHGYRGLEVGF